MSEKTMENEIRMLREEIEMLRQELVVEASGHRDLLNVYPNQDHDAYVYPIPSTTIWGSAGVWS